MTNTMCSCPRAGATELDLLDRLVNDHGWDQLAAARLLWGSGTTSDGARIVRAGLAPVIAWLQRAGVIV